jgi:peroxiredoxin family protein
MEVSKDMSADLEKQVAELKKKVEAIPPGPENKLAMVVFSGDMDKLLAALIIATGAVAMGMEVRLFFTFWATAALRDPKKKVGGKNFISTMFGFMLPKGFGGVTLSKMNMAGMGKAMIKGLMKKKNIPSLPELLEMAGQLGVRICVCDMSMDLMGFKREELVDYPNMSVCGVASFLNEAATSKVQLFI